MVSLKELEEALTEESSTDEDEEMAQEKGDMKQRGALWCDQKWLSRRKMMKARMKVGVSQKRRTSRCVPLDSQ